MVKSYNRQILYSSSELFNDAFLPRSEVACYDMPACIADQTEVEREVMYACYLHRQQLLSLEEMVEIGLGVYPVYLTSVGVDG